MDSAGRNKALGESPDEEVHPLEGEGEVVSRRLAQLMLNISKEDLDALEELGSSSEEEETEEEETVVVTTSTIPEKDPEKTTVEFDPILDKYDEWFGKWLPKDCKVSTLIMIKNVVKPKFENFTQEMMESDLKYCPHETLTNQYIIAFCEVCIGFDPRLVYIQMIEAKNILRAAIINSFITNEMSQVYIYLHNCVDAFIKSKLIGNSESSMTKKMVEEYVEKTSKMMDLTSDVAVATMKAAKGVFCSALRQYKDQIELLSEIVKMPSSSVEKIHDFKLLYLFARRQGRRRKDRISLPSETERLYLAECLRIDDDHPMVQTMTALIISDVVRASDNQLESIEVTSSLEFPTRESAINYVRRLAQKVFDKMDYSARINLFFVDCFTSLLPGSLRDYKTAKLFAEAALLSNPNSSKANHKMGIILHQEKEFDEAQKYFKKALEFDPRNFPAFMDYVQMLFRDPFWNRKQLTEVLGNSGQNDIWSSEQLSTMVALRGLFYISMGKSEDIIGSCWLDAYKMNNHEPFNTIRGIAGNRKRYEWGPNVLLTPQMIHVLEVVVRMENTPREDLAVYRRILDFLQKLELRESGNAAQNDRGRPNRGHRGGRDGDRTAGPRYDNGGASRQSNDGSSRGRGRGYLTESRDEMQAPAVAREPGRSNPGAVSNTAREPGPSNPVAGRGFRGARGGRGYGQVPAGKYGGFLGRGRPIWTRRQRSDSSSSSLD